MMHTWVQFVRTGSPEGSQGGVDSWPSLSTGSNVVLIWNNDGEPRVESPGPRAREVVAFWDRYYGVKP
ncbi:hypothetical protein F5Y09DRAFT_71198 [Xylaria sp. FL1042]|nr:hypothetical protein F5Y09DRAFT_71198 [Xylaria sp. FL1042]